MKIVLLGDSIFDNAAYVNEGESIKDILIQQHQMDVKLLALDGQYTMDIDYQLQFFGEKDALTFVSCGGNDALRCLSLINAPSHSINQSLEKLNVILQSFRKAYQNMLESVLKHTHQLVVCTIYNQIPGLPDGFKTALALFNEVILEEAIRYRLSIIDLRLVCHDPKDYSSVSSIEPSYQGAQKIAQIIQQVATTYDLNSSLQIYV